LDVGDGAIAVVAEDAGDAGLADFRQLSCKCVTLF